MLEHLGKNLAYFESLVSIHTRANIHHAEQIYACAVIQLFRKVKIDHECQFSFPLIGLCEILLRFQLNIVIDIPETLSRGFDWNIVIVEKYLSLTFCCGERIR